MIFLAGATPANSQVAHPPTKMYGTANAGDTIEALIQGRVCAITTASRTGFWSMQIPEGGKCGAKDGDTIRFTLNGNPTSKVETWKPGGAPTNVSTGVVLTNFGEDSKLSSTSRIPRDAPWYALMLGAFALAGLAGARARKTRLPGG